MRTSILFGRNVVAVVAALSVILFSAPVVSTDKSSLADIRAAQELRIGVDVPYGKMEFRDSAGSLAGVDIDIAKAVADHIGVAPKFVLMPFAELFPALNSGKLDLVISAVTITRERQKTLRFSTPYFDAALQIAIRKADKSISTLADLKNKTVGVLRGTVGADFARKSELITNTLIREFDNNETRLAALEGGDIDAIVMHFLLVDHATLKTLPEPISQSYYGVVSRLADAELMQLVDEKLREMKRSGMLRQIKARYFD